MLPASGQALRLCRAAWQARLLPCPSGHHRAGGSATPGGSALLSPALQDSRGEARGALPAPCHGAQAGRARDGLVDSSPLLFPKQPARRCHTRARGCTRKPSHSPCGKEAPATTCEYCLQVVLPPSPCAQSWGYLPTARLWGRESERQAVSDAGWQLPLPQRRLSSLLCPRVSPGAVPPAAFQGRMLLK